MLRRSGRSKALMEDGQRWGGVGGGWGFGEGRRKPGDHPPAVKGLCTPREVDAARPAGLHWGRQSGWGRRHSWGRFRSPFQLPPSPMD